MVKVGIDIIELDRFNSLSDNPDFISKAFDGSELSNDKKLLAAKFALKEAFFKASQIKIKNWNEIIIKTNGEKIDIKYDKSLVSFEINKIIAEILYKEGHAIGKIILNSQSR